MRAALVMALSLLAFVPALHAQTPPPPGTPLVDNPSGEGDPEAVTCRKPQRQVASRLPGPVVCKTNAVWAQYRKDGMDIAADGIHDVRSEKARTLNVETCTMIGGGSTSNAAMGMMRYICN